MERNVCGEWMALKTIHSPLLNSPLLTYIELLDESPVFIDVLLREIIEQAAALADHLEQTTASVMVLRIFRKVRRERVYISGEDCDLYLCAPGIVWRFAKL